MSAENPRGKGSAESSTDADNKDFSCSYCGDEYGSQPALNSHLGHKHADETRVTVACDYCGEEKTVIPSIAEQQENHFCGNECKGKYRSKSDEWCGENHHRYNRVSVECSYCGANMERMPCRIKDYENMYCNNECRTKHLRESGMREGKNNPVYNSVSLECVQCGDDFTVPVSIAEQGRKCCSKECGYEYKSETYRGENNWNYKGYAKATYGDRWQEVRNEVRKRDDYECQDCGVKENALDRELDVHHIIPLRTFDTPEQANKLDNLLSLCQSCHSKWEGLYLQPDSR